MLFNIDMEKEILIPEGYEARIEGNKVILGPKENEDEKIRKSIIRLLQVGGYMPDEEKKKAFSYLERQKEQKPERINVAEMVKKYSATDEYVEGEYKGKPVNCMIRAYEQGIRDTLSKVKEQKPAGGNALQKAFISSKIDYTLEEKCDASDYADAILPTSVAYGENEEEYKLHKIIEAAFIAGQKKGQKHAEWDKEDEIRLKEAIGVLDESIKYLPLGYGYTNDVRYVKNWLKSLRPQPKQEWSEEDEKNLKLAYDLLVNGVEADRRYPKLISWLKSLRPSWKPSEEQMKELEYAIELLGNMSVTNTLRELYADLKKL